ncbi:hypothetical protein KFL_001940120 [Klebsormidium nitens]|uniref:Uncharacterized protein n=1 Tax=Klebsormidium nitens TaxID=105231 RepID=A0A1Y1I0W5_KLENI|nr:hypothetical protein KFL_001940120 [Klebsormidium nitens]|eukprot:GAQ84555.1 hypothetical protein KFL_001940120 [Klebsormidium nitens]
MKLCSAPALLQALVFAALCWTAAAGPRGISEPNTVVGPGSSDLPVARLRPFAALTGPPTPKGITYHGGPILSKPLTVYFIWYGAAFTAAQKNIFKGLVSSFSPSSNTGNTAQLWWASVNAYYDGNQNHVSPTVALGADYEDSPGSQNSSLVITPTSNAMFDVVTHAITAGGLPVDPNGVYMVMGNQGTSVVGYGTCGTESECSSNSYGVTFCGWHSFEKYNGQTLHYGFVGVGAPACRPRGNMNGSPNGDPPIDAAANIFAHELAESATDPQYDAWWDDATQREAADRCNFLFGTTTPSASGGGNYNLVGNGGKQYLIQQFWDFTAGACVTTSASNVGGTVGGDPHFAAGYLNYTTESGEPEAAAIDFDFQGLPDRTFCISSDLHIALNARFVGGAPDERGVAGTWMDAIAIVWASETGVRRTLTVSIDQSKDFLDGDCYEIEYDGKSVQLSPSNETDVRWTSPDGQLHLARPPGHVGLPTWGNISIIVDGNLNLELTTEEEKRINLEPLGKFINMEVKGLTATRHVHGVLGQMFAPGGVQRRLGMAVSDENNREFVDGIVEDYITPSLTDPDCYYSEFLEYAREEHNKNPSRRKLLSLAHGERIHTARLSYTHRSNGGARTRRVLWR